MRLRLGDRVFGRQRLEFVRALARRPLKISFFETFEAGRDAGLSHVERVELSGEYTVQQDGNMFLPLLGSTTAAGMDLKQLQAQLGVAYRGLFGRAAAVSVLLVEREPVYVVGPVLRPGTFKFAPGMTVLHAVAMSGGLDNGTAEVSQFLELLRERERMQEAPERIKILLARSAVLSAERAEPRPRRCRSSSSWPERRTPHGSWAKSPICASSPPTASRRRSPRSKPR